MRNEELFTPEEIAQKLKLSKYTIYEMIKRGEIPAHRIGRSLRVTSSQFDTYLMRSSQSDNTFPAKIVVINDEKFAKVEGSSGDVYISVSTDLNDDVKISIKAEDIILSRSVLVCSARNNIEGIITGMEEFDNTYKITVNVGVPLITTVTKRSVQELDFKLGDTVYCVFKAMSVAVV